MASHNPGVDLDATAVLFQRGSAVGRFEVHELSSAGALLTGAHDVRQSAPLRLVLEMPGGPSFTVGGHVTRRSRMDSQVELCVAFRHLDTASEDRIQDAIVARLDRRYRELHPAVLVVEMSGDRQQQPLVELARGCGRRVRFAASPLDALAILDEPGEILDTVVMRESARAGELLDEVRDSYPHLRVLLCAEHARGPMVESCTPGELRTIVRAPR